MKTVYCLRRHEIAIRRCLKVKRHQVFGAAEEV